MCSGVVPQHPPTMRTPAHSMPPRVLRHVFRRTQIEVAALHAHRHARVGHGADRLGSERHHALDGFERGLGTHRTIDADHIGGPFVQAAGEFFRFGAAGKIAVIVDGDLRHDVISGPAASRAAKTASRAAGPIGWLPVFANLKMVTKFKPFQILTLLV